MEFMNLDIWHNDRKEIIERATETTKRRFTLIHFGCISMDSSSGSDLVAMLNFSNEGNISRLNFSIWEHCRNFYGWIANSNFWRVLTFEFRTKC